MTTINTSDNNNYQKTITQLIATMTVKPLLTIVIIKKIITMTATINNKHRINTLITTANTDNKNNNIER
jgi:hypothetical protein